MSAARLRSPELGRNSGRDYRTGLYRREPNDSTVDLYLRLLRDRLNQVALIEDECHWPEYADPVDVHLAVLTPKVLRRLKQLEEVAREVTRKSPKVARRRLYKSFAEKCGLSDSDLARLYRVVRAQDHNDIRKLAMFMNVRS